MGAGSVNIGVLLSEKLLPTVGLRLVFTESSESTKEEGDTHRHTHARQKKKKKKNTPAYSNTDRHTHNLRTRAKVCADANADGAAQ